MSSSSGEMPSRSAPRRPPRPERRPMQWQKDSGNASTSRSNVPSNPNLPSYEEIIPGTSSNLQRRGSEGDMQEQLSAQSSKPRRSRSMRKTSTQRTRPEITILSSQPMRNHPAFADGSKGSCVPPEAPPSYDEAMKGTSPKQASPLESSTAGHIAHRSRENSDIRNSPATARSTSHRNSETRIASTAVGSNGTPSFTRLPSSHFPPEQQSMVGMVPVHVDSRNCNRNQNNSDRLTQAMSHSENAFTSQSRPSNCSEPNHQTQTQVSANYSSPSILKSPNSTNRQTSKPPIPHKKPGLAAAGRNRNEASSGRTQDGMLSQSLTTSAPRRVDNARDANRRPVAPTRKLPPPPRPPIAAKGAAEPPLHAPVSQDMLETDESWPYSTIKDSAASNKIKRLERVSEKVGETCVVVEQDMLETDENSPYSTIRESAASNKIKRSERVCEKVVEASAENEPTPNKIEGTSDKSAPTKNEKSVDVSEPTYASVNKREKNSTPQVKPRRRSRVAGLTRQYDAVTVDQTRSNQPDVQPLPPPIPETRPPLEDYEGIFPTLASSSNAPIDSLTKKQNATGVINENFSPSLQSTSGHPSPMVRTKFQQDFNQTHDKIDMLPSEHGATGSTVGTDDALLNESTYEQIIYHPVNPAMNERAKPSPADRVKNHPPKPMLRPHLPPPVGGSNSNGNKTLCAESNTFLRKSSTPVGVNILRKSQTVKEKSIKPHSTVYNSERQAVKSSDAGTTKTSKSTLTSKAKSFSFSRQNERTPQQTNLEVKASPKSSNPSRHLSTYSTDKPRRTPPPRPPLPLVLQNRLRSKREARQNGATHASPIPVSAPHDGNSHLYSTPVHHYSHPKSVDTPTQPSPQPLNSLLPSSDVPPSPNPRTHRQAASLKASATFHKSTSSSATVATTPKPARPPPMKSEPDLADKSHKPHAGGANDNTESEESFIDAVNNANENKESTPSVDKQMKHYMTNESRYIATHDCQPCNFTGLSFSAGEKILVLKQIDDDLLFGRNENGDEGPFPRKYVCLESNANSPVSELPSTTKTAHSVANSNANNNTNNSNLNVKGDVIGKAVALYDYKARDKDDLSFIAGNEIEIVGNVGSEWLKGRIGQSVGMFPRDFVSFTPLQVNIGRDSRLVTQKRQSHAVALYDFTGVHDNELSLGVGDRVEVLCRVDDEWLQGKFQGKVGIFPSAFVNMSSVNLSHENDLSSSVPGKFNGHSESPKSFSDNNKSVKRPKVPEKEKAADPLGFAVALYGFIGQDDSELTFNGHDVITITEKIDDEWFKGKMNGKSGMFPANYVKVTRMIEDKH